MEAKEALQQLRYASNELQELYETRAGVFDMLTSTTARFSPTGSRQAGDAHRMDVLGELTDRVDEKIADLAALRVRALDWIGRLEDTQQRAVLLAYYVNCRRADGELVNWDDVAERLHMSRRTTLRVYAAAVDELGKVGIDWHCPPVV